MPRRCALGCASKDARLHVFPNPKKFPEQFKAWAILIGGDVDNDAEEIYRTKRICDRHFVDKDRVRNNRLSAIAIPTLYLHGYHHSPIPETPLQSSPIVINQEHRIETALSSHSGGNVQTPYLNEEPKVDIRQGIIHQLSLSASDTPMPSAATSNRPKSSAVTSNKYRVYQKQIKNLRRQVYSLQKSHKSFKARLEQADKFSKKGMIEKVLSKMAVPARLFINMQNQAPKKPKGRRFQLEEKVLSLSLYKRSPKCYSLLSKYFTLPAPKTLKRLLSKIKITPGVNEIVFDKIKKTVKDLDHEDRLCTLIFDEMSISPQVLFNSAGDELNGLTDHGESKIANRVLVFMVKGVKRSFKQPVAYYFTNSLNKYELKNFIKEVAKNVFKAGLIIVASTCDQSTVNVSAINLLVTETKEKYLRKKKEMRGEFFEIQNKKVIPLFDVPHLLKGLRNNLLSKDMYYTDYDDNNTEKTVKWDYFQMLYAADKSFGELRCLQKLTEEHIVLEKIKKMRVKIAAQVFSHSVAVATEHLTARGLLATECRNLVPIVLLIDNLFDSLNCNSFYIPNGKVYKGPVKQHSPHHQLWQKAIKILKSIKFKTCKKVGNKVQIIESVPPSIKNFIKTIEGFQELWKILSQKYSLDVMLTRNFNQDPVENFFGNIRSYGARNVSPNSVGFDGAYKSLLLNNYNSPHSVQSNCEDDSNKCLQTLDFFITDNITSDISEEEVIDFRFEFCAEDNIEESDPGQRTYVCGWVLKKCLKNIVKSCKNCKADLLAVETDDRCAYIRAKEFYKNKKWLCYPSKELDKCFQDIQNICVSHLKKNVPKKGLKKKIKMYNDIFVSFPFKCDIHKEKLRNYFEDTTLNILINSWCRSINRILAGKITYTGDDEMKVAAQSYYNKNKNFKLNK